MASRRNRVKLTDLHPITFMNDQKFLSTMDSLKNANSSRLDALWAEAASTVIYAYNRLPRKSGKESKYTLFHRRIPKVKNLGTFGQRAVMLDKSRRGFDAARLRLGKKVRFVGYGDRYNVYRIYCEENKQIYVTCDLKFLDSATAE